MFAGLFMGLSGSLSLGLGLRLDLGLACGLISGLLGGLYFGLVETRSVMITPLTPTEASTSSLVTALAYALISALVLELILVLAYGLVGLAVAMPMVKLVRYLSSGLSIGLATVLIVGPNIVMINGGWFVFLQKVAHRRLARAGNLPPRPYDFLECGIEIYVFRRVGAEYAFATTSSSNT